jgi:hypothetical protein
MITDLDRRISELADKVAAENETARLLDLVAQLNAAIDEKTREIEKKSVANSVAEKLGIERNKTNQSGKSA